MDIFTSLFTGPGDFKLEKSIEESTIPNMRYLALFLVILLSGGCESTDNSYVPGRIPRETAIAIAERANPQFPYPLSKVTRAVWRGELGYWAIDFKDEDENYGRFYLVNGKGKIVGTGKIVGDQYY